MSKTTNAKIGTALKRAAKTAKTGPRTARSGRFLHGKPTTIVASKPKPAKR